MAYTATHWLWQQCSGCGSLFCSKEDLLTHEVTCSGFEQLREVISTTLLLPIEEVRDA